MNNIHLPKRSSFKRAFPSSSQDKPSIPRSLNKRNSVSWNTSDLAFKEIKTSFQIDDVKKRRISDASFNQNNRILLNAHKLQFIEKRRKSVKDEYSVVKELLKKMNNSGNDDTIEESEEEAEVKSNTIKNAYVSKENEGDELFDEDELKAENDENNENNSSSNNNNNNEK